MKPILALATMLAVTSPQVAAYTQDDPLCEPLMAFVKSVRPDDTRELIFQTSWGSNFKGEKEPALYAKSCTHNDYAPAKAVCENLMQHGAIEFAGGNAEAALECLSPGTRFAPGMYLEQGYFSFNVGTSDRGSNVSLEFHEDTQSGGMALKIVVDGY